MTRIYSVTKSRTDRACIGGHVIPAGSAYRYATPGFRGRTIYSCPLHPFRSSHLTANDILSDYYRAVEGLEDDLSAWDEAGLDDLTEALEVAQGAVDECISQWEEQLDNLGTLSEGDAGQVIQERLDGAQAWRDALDTASDALSDVGWPEDEQPDEGSNVLDEAIEAARDAVQSALDESTL